MPQASRSAGIASSSRRPARRSRSIRWHERCQLPERRPDGSLFGLPEPVPAQELFEKLAAGNGITIERIVSTGQATPAGEWLEQDRDEWVVLLEGEAELAYADGSRLVLGPGDHVLIAAGERHRVERTRERPPCIWLAVHADGLVSAVVAHD